MSTHALDALKAVELLDKNLRVPDLSGVTDTDLQKKLNYYWQARMSGPLPKALSNKGQSNDFSALISSISARNDVPSLLPSSLIYNQTYSNDPLMRMGRQGSEIQKTYNQHLGMGGARSPNRQQVEDGLRHFAALAPLIQSGFLEILPMEEIHELPKEEIPIYYSEDWFRSSVPSHIHDFVHQHANIREMAPGPEGKGLLVYNDPPAEPTRGIAIDFKNDAHQRQGNFYLLYEQEFLGENSDETVSFRKQLDWQNPPERYHYDAWVYQSINRAIVSRLDRVSSEMALASDLGASYLTESEFEARLCGLSGQKADRQRQDICAVNFLEATFPQLRNINASLIASIRTESPQLFERWQQSILGISEQLSGCPGDFETKAKQLFAREVQPQLDEIDAAFRKAATATAGGTMIGVSAVGFALVSATNIPLATIMALGSLQAIGEAVTDVSEYFGKRSSPAFIWKKLLG
jgi:hypothetical protein